MPFESLAAHAAAMETGQDIGDFTLSNGRYCIPTRAQSGRILEVLDSITASTDSWGRHDIDDTIADSLREFLNEVIATSDNYVTDIAKHLRQIGIHIVKEEDFREFQEAKDALTRSAIIGRMQQDKLEVEKLWEEQQSKEA